MLFMIELNLCYKNYFMIFFFLLMELIFDIEIKIIFLEVGEF